MPGDLDFQNLSTVASAIQQKPVTIIAAATIAPTTFLSRISGTTAIATITPPVSGCHMIAIIGGTADTAYTTAGNIIGATTASTTQPSLFVFDPITAKYMRTV